MFATPLALPCGWLGLEVNWWSQAGSNRRPPACKAGALPAELWPPRRHTIQTYRTAPAPLTQSDLSLGGLPLVGLGGLEPPTSPLSGVRSNRLSYRPEVTDHPVEARRHPAERYQAQTICVGAYARVPPVSLKEVIQPQVPLRLPCYDFTPVMNHTVVSAPPISLQIRG
jgi:hypothetical protein